MGSYSHGEMSNARLWFVSPYPGGSSLQREKKDPSTQGNAVYNVAQMCHEWCAGRLTFHRDYITWRHGYGIIVPTTYRRRPACRR